MARRQKAIDRYVRDVTIQNVLGCPVQCAFCNVESPRAQKFMATKKFGAALEELGKKYDLSDALNVLYSGRGNPIDDPELRMKTELLRSRLGQGGRKLNITLAWPLHGGLNNLAERTRGIDVLRISLSSEVLRAIRRELKKTAVPSADIEDAVLAEAKWRLRKAADAAAANGFKPVLLLEGTPGERGQLYRIAEEAFKGSRIPFGRVETLFSGLEPRGSALGKSLGRGGILILHTGKISKVHPPR
ncbi:Uncharacterised protein [Candidatus Norongarragalina meridionalis]|nr:Uncharacterised protein [Candidatus Norongarragalina meridionalis]